MRQSVSVLVVLVLLPSVARGQPAPTPLPRVDVAVATGWFAADRSIRGDGCCSSWSSSLFKGVSGGYYWTEHHKTEVELAAPGPTDGFSSFSERLATGSFRYTYERHAITAARLSLAQAYQYGHNAFIHPFVRGGVDIDRERDEVERYTSIGPIQTEEESTATATRVRPFAAVGFKAYFSDRAFFRGEAKFNVGRNQLSQMAWTAGVGIDFPNRRRVAAPTAPLQESVSTASPREAEPLETWRRYVSQLPVGSLVDVATDNSGRFTAALLSSDDTGIVVLPATRIPEPGRRIAFEHLEALALHGGSAPGRRVGAIVAGSAAGAGTFLTLLAIAFSLYGD